jgi:DNA-directed RNA polymerase subunit beta'
MVLGLYYLTKSRIGTKGEGKKFASMDDVLIAHERGEVQTLTPIKLRYTGKVLDMTTSKDSQAIMQAEPVEYNKQDMDTTVGRVILNDVLPKDMPFVNGLLKKKGLTQLVGYCYLKFGLHTTVKMLDDIKQLGFQYATRAGISIGIDDMVVPAQKPTLVKDAEKQVIEVQNQYQSGAITHGERYNKIIEIWTRVTEQVSDLMFKQMEADDRSGRYLNPIYIMADSGARGSKQQIRQLSGMRGLMAKPSGEIIETPITANFREGLNVLQYFISTHGARKGLADTALKTADSGYLTRRLVDVAQDVIISDYDCGTGEGLYVEPIVEAGEIIEPLRDRIVGRVVLEDQMDFENNKIVGMNQLITEDLAKAMESAGIERVKIRSVLTCESRRGVCQLCYGRNLATGRLVERGEAVGVIAAQSIGEPGTQLTMRTFHIGGAATRASEQNTQEAKKAGFVKYIAINTVKNAAGEFIAMNRNGIIAVVDEKGRERERYQVVYGAKVKFQDGAPVAGGDRMLEWDPYSFSILTEISGVVHFKDLEEGFTVLEQVDDVSGLSQLVVVDSPDGKKIPTVIVRPEGGTKHDEKRYLMPTHAHLMVRDGDKVHAADVIAKIPRATSKTKDITGGLPRVVELFEARKPRDPAAIAEINGIVRFGEVTKSSRKVYITGDDGQEREYAIPRGAHINVQEGERVMAGDQLVDGPINPHDILHVRGEKELQKYLVKEVQEVYRLQGVNINDKHLEVIVRQMLRWLKVEDIGDTDFLPEEVVDRFKFKEENERANDRGGRRAHAKPILLGITKASLSTDSFISAASFQETTRVLTEAAINSKRDGLRGLKENVIMGRLIPAGTGMDYYRGVRIAGEGVQEEEPQQEPEISFADSMSDYEESTRPFYAGGLSETEGAPEEPSAE